MANKIDLSNSVEYDIEPVQRFRTLNFQIDVESYSGDTFLGVFDFSLFTGATLQVRSKPNDLNLIIEFNTVDGSIILNSGSFTLKKTHVQMDIRAGDYYYDMYLSNALEKKRGFLHGRFKITDTVSR